MKQPSSEDNSPNQGLITRAVSLGKLAAPEFNVRQLWRPGVFRQWNKAGGKRHEAEYLVTPLKLTPTASVEVNHSRFRASGDYGREDQRRETGEEVETDLGSVTTTGRLSWLKNDPVALSDAQRRRLFSSFNIRGFHRGKQGFPNEQFKAVSRSFNHRRASHRLLESTQTEIPAHLSRGAKRKEREKQDTDDESCVFEAEEAAKDELDIKGTSMKQSTSENGSFGYLFGVYGTTDVWLDKHPPNATINPSRDYTAYCYARDLHSIEEEEFEAEGEYDPVDHHIRQIHTFTFVPGLGVRSGDLEEVVRWKRRALRYRKTEIGKEDLPAVSRTRPKCKVAVCLLVRLTGYTKTTLRTEINTLKRIILGYLWFVSFKCYRDRSVPMKQETVSVSTTRKLQEGDVEVYLLKTIRYGGTSLIKSTDRRVKIGFQIWVKKDNRDRVAKVLLDNILTGDFSRRVALKLTKLYRLNQVYNPKQLKIISRLVQNQTGSNQLSPAQTKLRPIRRCSEARRASIACAAISQNTGHHTWKLHLELLKETDQVRDIDEDAMKHAKQEMTHRGLERRATKTAFEQAAAQLSSLRELLSSNQPAI